MAYLDVGPFVLVSACIEAPITLFKTVYPTCCNREDCGPVRCFKEGLQMLVVVVIEVEATLQLSSLQVVLQDGDQTTRVLVQPFVQVRNK